MTKPYPPRAEVKQTREAAHQLLSEERELREAAEREARIRESIAWMQPMISELDDGSCFVIARAGASMREAPLVDYAYTSDRLVPRDTQKVYHTAIIKSGGLWYFTNRERPSDDDQLIAELTSINVTPDELGFLLHPDAEGVIHDDEPHVRVFLIAPLGERLPPPGE